MNLNDYGLSICLGDEHVTYSRQALSRLVDKFVEEAIGCENVGVSGFLYLDIHLHNLIIIYAEWDSTLNHEIVIYDERTPGFTKEQHILLQDESLNKKIVSFIEERVQL